MPKGMTRIRRETFNRGVDMNDFIFFLNEKINILIYFFVIYLYIFNFILYDSPICVK